jgi:hypothetical protein
MSGLPTSAYQIVTVAEGLVGLIVRSSGGLRRVISCRNRVNRQNEGHPNREAYHRSSLKRPSFAPHGTDGRDCGP